MTKQDLVSMEHLDAVVKASFETAQIIFKHSTSCNISSDAWNELQKSSFSIHYLDLLSYRPISNEIAERFGVIHKSPQVLVIKDGKCTYHESHWNIKNEVIQTHL